MQTYRLTVLSHQIKSIELNYCIVQNDKYGAHTNVGIINSKISERCTYTTLQHITHFTLAPNLITSAGKTGN